MKKPPTVDPMEQIIREALHAAGIHFVEDPHPLAKGLDFYLPKFDVHIEVKQFHAGRIAEQMSRASDVIAIQGIEAAQFFAAMINITGRRQA